MKPRISVIIPVYNEMTAINACLAHVRRQVGGVPVEIIVADGGPDHSTLKAMTEPDVIGVASPPGRGVQMNAGAAVARGDILLFLHADTCLPSGGLDAVVQAIEGGAVAGAFSLSIDSPRWGLKVVAWFANLRSRLERVPYGDQAQFIRAETFRGLGGYAPIPIMEDVDLFRRIRQLRLPMTLLSEKVATSSRRWDNEGVLLRTLNNWWLRLRFRFGASPQSLARQYRPHNSKVDSE